MQFGTVTEVVFLSPSSCTVRMANAQRRGEVVIGRQHTICGGRVEVADSVDSVVFVNRVPTDHASDDVRDYMAGPRPAVSFLLCCSAALLLCFLPSAHRTHLHTHLRTHLHTHTHKRLCCGESVPAL
eukprot:2993729-Rhodomonas_salina.3